MKQLKADLTAAGIEVYRTKKTEIQVAERIRLHIMDSGVRVHLTEDAPRVRVTFTARSQRSDFPDDDASTLFAKVRAAIGPNARARGFVESAAGSVEVKDPMDATRILDVWHEVTYEKSADDANAALEEIRWALALERYVQR